MDHLEDSPKDPAEGTTPPVYTINLLHPNLTQSTPSRPTINIPHTQVHLYLPRPAGTLPSFNCLLHTCHSSLDHPISSLVPLQIRYWMKSISRSITKWRKILDNLLSWKEIKRLHGRGGDQKEMYSEHLMELVLLAWVNYKDKLFAWVNHNTRRASKDCNIITLDTCFKSPILHHLQKSQFFHLIPYTWFSQDLQKMVRWVKYYYTYLRIPVIE